MTKEMKYLKSDFAQQSPDKNYKEFVKWSLKNKPKKKKKWFSCTLVCLTRESLAVITNDLARVSWRNVDRLKQIYSVQFSSVAQSCLILCNPMNCSTPGLPVHHQLPESTQTHVHWVSDAIQPSHPLLSPSPPALNLSQHQGLFKWVSSWHQVAKALSFSFKITPINEYPGLISFRMDWLDLLAVQGTLKSLLQHHSSKLSILWHSVFFL